MATTAKQCAGRRRDGQPCRSPAVGQTGYCFAHDPAQATERTEVRAKGGRNRSKAARIRGLVPPRLVATFDTLENLLAEVHAGKITPARATAMATVARAMVAVLTAGEMEERLRKLEETQEARRG